MKNCFLLLSSLKICIILFLDRLRRGAYCVARVTCLVEISIETSKDRVTSRKGKTLQHRLEWMERRCMIEMNNFQYISSTLNGDITTSDVDVKKILAIATGHLPKLNKL